MMKIPRTPLEIVAGLATLALSGVFLYAGVTKMLNPVALADAIDGYRLPIRAVTGLIATTLPPLEVAVALALWHPRWRGAALLSLGAMGLVFLAALAQAAARGFTVDCGCFGAAKPSAQGMAVAMLRDLAICAAAAWLYARHSRARIASTGTPSGI